MGDINNIMEDINSDIDESIIVNIMVSNVNYHHASCQDCIDNNSIHIGNILSCQFCLSELCDNCESELFINTPESYYHRCEFRRIYIEGIRYIPDDVIPESEYNDSDYD
jgi:hypothetical protein